MFIPRNQWLLIYGMAKSKNSHSTTTHLNTQVKFSCPSPCFFRSKKRYLRKVFPLPTVYRSVFSRSASAVSPARWLRVRIATSTRFQRLETGENRWRMKPWTQFQKDQLTS